MYDTARDTRQFIGQAAIETTSKQSHQLGSKVSLGPDCMTS